MEYQIDDVITFNNAEYLIVDVIKNGENTYLYMINNDEYENDVAVLKVLNKNSVIEYEHIKKDDEFNYVINQIFLNSKDEIIELISNE